MTGHYEFGGPIGTLGLTVGLPAVVVLLWALCNDAHGCSAVPPWPSSVHELLGFVHDHLVLTQTAALLLGNWLLFQVVLHFVLPGPLGYGLVQPDGSRDTYRLNGLTTLFVVTATVAAATYIGIPLEQLYDLFPQLLAVTLLFSVILSVYVYATSFLPGTRIAEPGNSGNVFYDFWMGRPFAPFIGPLDVKFFCEQRPGLMAWCLFNFAFALKQYKEQGHVSLAMVLVNVFHYIYVVDTFVFEPAVLSTMDITTEGFGFMLCFGDLVWVPFTYSLQARYLVTATEDISWPFAVLLVAMFTVGFLIFRFSNLQKDRFRRNPDDPAVSQLRYIKTERGSRLLAGGWWGIARHINYLGDWLLFFASCLACGFNHVIPYFYAVYFGALLIHREIRDDHKCARKYGRDWEKYRQMVPWRIIPFIY